MPSCRWQPRHGIFMDCLSIFNITPARWDRTFARSPLPRKGLRRTHVMTLCTHSRMQTRLLAITAMVPRVSNFCPPEKDRGLLKGLGCTTGGGEIGGAPAVLPLTHCLGHGRAQPTSSENDRVDKRSTRCFCGSLMQNCYGTKG